MTTGEYLEQIEGSLGITKQHYSVLGRIKDIAHHLDIETDGRLLSEILHEIGGFDDTNLMSEMLERIMNSVAYELKTATGNPITLEDSIDHAINAFAIYGKTTQNGTPSPDNPIDLVSVENPKVTVFKENLITLPYRATSSGTVTMNGVTFTVSESGTIHAEGTATANTFFVINEPWLAQGTYYLRAKGAISANARFQIFEYDSSFPIIYAEVNTSESNVSITIPSFARVKLAFRVASGATLNGDFDFCFARTDVDEVYPIIAPSSVSLPYTLRSIGDVHDELRVNADGSGEFVQRISNEKSITSFNGFYVFSYVSCNDYLPVSGRTKVMSNRFIFKNSEKTNGICFGYGNQLRFYLADDVTNVGEANAWLAEHPTTYCYPLAEPIVTSLTASEVSAILALQTHKPITNILNDGGADMKVTYCADRAQVAADDENTADLIYVMGEM